MSRKSTRRKGLLSNADKDLRNLPEGPRPAKFRPDEPDLPRDAAVRRYRVRRAGSASRRAGRSRSSSSGCSERLFGRPTVAHAAGRTDAGVHATGLGVSFAAPPWTATSLHRALNALLPPDCWVESVHAMQPGFHARKSAISSPLSLRHRPRSRCGFALPPAVRVGPRSSAGPRGTAALRRRAPRGARFRRPSRRAAPRVATTAAVWPCPPGSREPTDAA